jgi:hypothetical protein
MDVSSDSAHNFVTNGIVWLSREYWKMHIHVAELGMLQYMLKYAINLHVAGNNLMLFM